MSVRVPSFVVGGDTLSEGYECVGNQPHANTRRTCRQHTRCLFDRSRFPNMQVAVIAPVAPPMSATSCQRRALTGPGILDGFVGKISKKPYKSISSQVIMSYEVPSETNLCGGSETPTAPPKGSEPALSGVFVAERYLRKPRNSREYR